MSVLRRNAMWGWAFSTCLAAMLIGSGGVGWASEECIGFNKKQLKYGCEKKGGGGNLFSLFGSEDDSTETQELKSESNQPASQDHDGFEFEDFSSDISYPALTGPKRTIAVLTFENKVDGVYGASEIGFGLTEILITELHNTNHFILVERSALREILKEQELALTGLVRQEGTPAAGGFAGAQLLIKGVITEFDYRSGGGGMGLNVAGMNLSNKTSEAHVAIDVRLIDPNTATIMDSVSVAVKAPASGWNVGYKPQGQDFTIGTGFFEKTPLGQAGRHAVQQAVAAVVARSSRVPWAASVVKSDGGTTYINRGKNSNIQAGDRFEVFSKGETLVDPETGLVLGADEEPIGMLTLTEVRKKFAIGQFTPYSPELTPQRGDVVRYEGQASSRDSDLNF